MTTKCARRLSVGVVVVATLLAPCALVGALRVTPTLARVQADVAGSVALKTINPMTSVPPLTSLSGLDTSVRIWPVCYNTHQTFSVPRSAETLCAFGNTKAKRTVLLIGDSQAAMWSPTLRAFGKAYGWKIVMLAKSGCGNWGNPNPPNFKIFETLTQRQCDTWNKSVAAWANAHHPQVIVLVSRGYPKGADRDRSPMLATLNAEIKTEIARLAPSRSRLIVISPIPRFTKYDSKYLPSECESIPGSIPQCNLSPSKLIPKVELAAETTAAAHHLFRLAVITPLMCTKSRCTIVTKDGSKVHLMYFDGSHINQHWGTWVLPAFVSILQPLLP